MHARVLDLYLARFKNKRDVCINSDINQIQEKAETSLLHAPQSARGLS